MTRWIAACACALTVALAMPFGHEAAADGVTSHHYGHIQCIAPARMWAPQSRWVCRASQKCCYDYLLRKGNCVDATSRCF